MVKVLAVLIVSVVVVVVAVAVVVVVVVLRSGHPREHHGQRQQQKAESGRRGGHARDVAVVAVATVDPDPRGAVALAVGLAAEGLVGAGLHHPACGSEQASTTEEAHRWLTII